MKILYCEKLRLLLLHIKNFKKEKKSQMSKHNDTQGNWQPGKKTQSRNTDLFDIALPSENYKKIQIRQSDNKSLDNEFLGNESLDEDFLDDDFLEDYSDYSLNLQIQSFQQIQQQQQQAMKDLQKFNLREAEKTREDTFLIRKIREFKKRCGIAEIREEGQEGQEEQEEQKQSQETSQTYQMQLKRGETTIFHLPYQSAGKNTDPFVTNVVDINKDSSMIEVGIYPKDYSIEHLDPFSKFSYMYFYKYYFDQLFLDKELIQLIDGEHQKLINGQLLEGQFYDLFSRHFPEKTWGQIKGKLWNKNNFLQIIMDYFEQYAHQYALAQHNCFARLISNNPNNQQAKAFIQTIETVMKINDFLDQSSEAQGFGTTIQNYSSSFQKKFVIGSKDQIANLLITKQKLLCESMIKSQNNLKDFFNPQQIMEQYYEMQQQLLENKNRKENNSRFQKLIYDIGKSNESVQVVQVGQCYYSNDDMHIYNATNMKIDINDPTILKDLIGNKSSWKNIHLVTATIREKKQFVKYVKDYFESSKTFKQYDCEKIFYCSEMDNNKFNELMSRSNPFTVEEQSQDENGILIREYEGEKIIIVKDSTIKRKGMILKLEDNNQEKQKFDEAKFPNFDQLLSNCLNKNTTIRQIKQLTNPSRIMKLTYAKVVDYHNLFSITDSLTSKQEMNNFENKKQMQEEEYQQGFDSLESSFIDEQMDDSSEEEESKERSNPTKKLLKPQMVEDRMVKTKEISAINDFSSDLNCCYLAEPIVNAFKQMSTGLLLENKYVFYFGLKKLITKIIGSVCPPIESKDYTKSKDFQNFKEFIKAVFYGSNTNRKKEINEFNIQSLRSVLIQQSRTALRLFSQLYGTEINFYLCEQISNGLQQFEFDINQEKNGERLFLSGITIQWERLFSVDERVVKSFNKTYAKLLIYTNVVAQMCNRFQNDENNQAFLSEYSQRMIKKLSLILFPHRRSTKKMDNIDLFQFFMISAEIFALLQGFNNIREIFYEQAKIQENKEIQKMLERGKIQPIRINKYFYLSMFSGFRIKLIIAPLYLYPLKGEEPQIEPEHRRHLKDFKKEQQHEKKLQRERQLQFEQQQFEEQQQLEKQLQLEKQKQFEEWQQNKKQQQPNRVSDSSKIIRATNKTDTNRLSSNNPGNILRSNKKN
ncbi:hypothetical protein TTHERM_00874720 (macronuclear) [Tetrahymena thermophila SB210]|uniref:Uncharacterized protein n=1 Tax=Tetrahymena thermophila (strain SB210) TaxID=312017 RepID=Q22LI3_TETTS|nr:hypothetical protein TTHERM_00874720 [Tetrahymena thermophila SB210]EAR86157.2 hypothetical protein TTHERM_00874720 [Tetrahymena thermophila SB210]|eukprot:XP_976752.2 hypothetical protein TTHERM_00874720 [Tetrahymena thermophila SB210]